jgi:hypothetical protein
LNRIGILVASLSFVLFAVRAQGEDASSAPAAFEFNVQIVKDGAVIDTVHVPAGGRIDISGAFQSRQAIGKDGTTTTTIIPNVPLVATVAGQPFMLSQSDQLILTRTRVEQDPVGK